MIKNNSRLLYIGLWLSSVYLLVDSLNGYLIRIYDMDISISQVFKLCLMGIFIYSIGKKKLITFLIPLIFLILWIGNSVFLDSNNYQYLLKDIQLLLKAYFIFTSYVFFSFIINNYPWLYDRVIYVVYLCFLVLSVNIILGIMGIGFHQYSNNIGGQGFLYAGNEVSLALIVSGGVILFHLLEKQKMSLYLIFSAIFIFIAILKVTKTAIFSSMILVIIFPFLSLFPKITKFKINRTNLKNILITSLLLVFFIPLIINFVLYELDLYSRISYFFDKYNNWTTVIFSSRNIWAIEAIDLYLNDYSVIELLFGKGYSVYDLYFAGKVVEIDLLDILMTYGLVGSIFLYGLFIYILQLSFRYFTSKSYIYAKYVGLMTLLLIAISLTAGHVVMSGIAGLLIGLMFAISHHNPSRKIEYHVES